MFCPKCGRQLEEGTSFCPNCGTAQQSNVTNKQTDSVSISKSFLKKGILVAVVTIVLLCAGFAFLSTSFGDKNTGTQGTATIGTAKVVGKWEKADNSDNVVLSINKDNTGEMVSGGWAVKFTWEYSNSTRELTLDFEMLDLPGQLTYNAKDDTLVFKDGDVLIRAK